MKKIFGYYADRYRHVIQNVWYRSNMLGKVILWLSFPLIIVVYLLHSFLVFYCVILVTTIDWTIKRLTNKDEL